MKPEFDISGNLPSGIHPATWAELEARFGVDAHRKRLLAGMKDVLLSLKIAGYRTVFVDGSFVTQTDFPADFDLCSEMANVSERSLKKEEQLLVEPWRFFAATPFDPNQLRKPT